ncbi:MAG: hypothetical protein A2W98_10215 [Bacteroidetes bacterium GWF2_33_38]|nr:MAG: hypothetical protein A2W98_10215 [Bacteroidetes bacterium GWF2_33_38]
MSSGIILAQSSGTLQGIVKDPATGESVPFANVSLESKGSSVTGGMTDFDGKYVIKPVPAGTYDVKVSYVGYSSQQVNGVVVNGGKITFLDFKMTSSVQQIDEVVITGYIEPLIKKDAAESGGTVTSEAIAKMPGRSAEAVATTVGGVFSENGEVGSIRGARDEGNVTYIDGIKVRGTSNLPKSAVEQVSVITGGMPAEYGDATGGVISIVTKGPSKKFYGAIEGESSHFLDPYDHNLLGFNVSGPLLSVTDKRDSTKKNPVMGFLIAGEFSYVKDDYPSAIGVWKANDDALDYITQNPLVAYGEGTVLSADYLDTADFYNIKAKENIGMKRANFSAKVEYQPSLNFNVTVGGTVDYLNRHEFIYSNSLFNSQNNPQNIYLNWRTYARLTQKFIDLTPDEEQAKSSLLKNAYYQIQIDYSRSTSVTQDDTHKDNVFNYGHVGTFEIDRVSSYGFGVDTVNGQVLSGYVLNGFRDTIVRFTPSEINPESGQYTQTYFDMYDDIEKYRNLNTIQAGGAILNGERPGEFTNNRVYALWTLPGVQYNEYSKYEANQYRVTAKGAADIKNHEISVGFEFEQREDSYYGISPIGLWSLARGLMNNHIIQLDLENPIAMYTDDGTFKDTINYNRQYDKESQAEFDINFRDYLGVDLDSREWIDVDSYDPSELSIDYFSADELFNSGNSLVTYYGYDHHGNKMSGNPSLQDFFDATYEDKAGNTRFKREVPAFRPNYMAGYIQDKFAFKDLIFRVGVRVDRYDANQKVLKDAYSLSAIQTAGELNSLAFASDFELPSNIGEDYAVYVDDANNPSVVKGFRNGSVWYNAEGTEINDPTVISGASGITPLLYEDDAQINEVGYDSDKTFEDYKPQISISPRVGFSFPISDVAVFTAHYDVLTKRPSYGGRLDPIQYYYINSMNSDVLNNPNAKPEKTIDYELGFQQKLNNTSALKLSAFYREMRDMQQVVNIYGAYPVNYMTYGNIDFGTVKGFTLSYDLRRTGNVTIRASYTLQFANGTGSNAETGINLAKTNQPNLRTTIPFDYDQRHAIVTSLDYRYGEGAEYNGPKWFGMDIFQNTGANFVFNVGSGSPYSRQLNITSTQFNNVGSTSSGSNSYLEGSINGSRKPWRTTINMRIDRDIFLEFGKEGEEKKEIYLNVYLDVANLLNTKNILNVYRATGNPDDDGYLNSADFQDQINAQNDVDAFVNYYSMAVNSPYNYTLPRRIIFGVSLSF